MDPVLQLTLTNQTNLLDLDPLNSQAGVIGTGFDDPNNIVETAFDSYDSGRIMLNTGEAITIAMPLSAVARFIMIESRLKFDLEYTQPAYTRTLSVTTDFPENIVTLTSLARLQTQFGVFSKFVLTSAEDNNAIKWMWLGQKTFVL